MIEEITLDFSEIDSKVALHDYLAEMLHFPAYYGKNLDALWDCITTDTQSTMPKRLVIKETAVLKSQLPSYYSRFIQILQAYQVQFPEREIVFLDDLLSDYLAAVDAQKSDLQPQINHLLEKYQAQPVGNGYIDVIIDRANVFAFLDELTTLGIAVDAVTWWCHYTPLSKETLGCPHGMGGPINKFGEGRFSECEHYPVFDVQAQGVNFKSTGVNAHVLSQQANQLVHNYLTTEWQHEPFYSDCLRPGLWLHLPLDWVRSE